MSVQLTIIGINMFVCLSLNVYRDKYGMNQTINARVYLDIVGTELIALFALEDNILTQL